MQREIINEFISRHSYYFIDNPVDVNIAVDSSLCVLRNVGIHITAHPKLNCQTVVNSNTIMLFFTILNA